MPRERKSLDEHLLQSTKPNYVLPDSDVESSRPRCPNSISGEAKRTFKRLVKMLQARRTVTQGDAEVLRLYALLWDRHERAIQHIADEGEIVLRNAVSKSGEVYEVERENMWLDVAQNSETKMTALLVQLGMTPRARTTVKQTKSAPKAEETFPTREEAAAAAKEASDAELLASIDETVVSGVSPSAELLKEADALLEEGTHEEP